MKITPGKRTSGMTLVEVMTAMGIGALLITAMAGFIFYDSTSKVAIMNYIDLNQRSMQALDKMTSELRGMSRMISYSTNRIVIRNADGENVAYEWDIGQQTLTRKNTTLGGMAEVLLENCYDAEFQMFSAVPPTFGNENFTATTNPSLCKMLLLRWSCERDISGRGLRNTESVQTAKIVLRN